MRRHTKWSLTALLAGLFVAPVLGQSLFRADVVKLLQQGVDSPLLLRMPSVQKEIKLTDEQAEKFRKIAKDVQSKNPGNLQKNIQEIRAKVNKAIPDILSADQAKRLHQLKVQANGSLSFKEPEVQQKLKLTDKQKEQMQDINESLKKDVRQLIEDSKNLRERVEAARKVPQLMKEATGKAVAVLNDEQKKTWNEMIGEKFDFKTDLVRSSSEF